MTASIRVGDRTIGAGAPVFVIAEIGLNHNGDPALAAQLIRTAAASGVDGVKFQRRHTDALLTQELADSSYDAWYAYGKTYGEHREALELSMDVWRELQALAEGLGVVFFASAWDLPSVDDCEELGLPLYKVASADVTNLPLLEAIAKTGKPILLSTGMSTEAEIADAVAVIRRFHDHLVLLACVSTYPAEFSEINLASIPWLRERFECPVGYSGHERGIAVSAAAVALGACAVERHFTIDRTMKGPDHAASLEPPGLMKLVRDIRAVQLSFGAPKRDLVEREVAVRRKLGKSLVTSAAFDEGHVIGEDDLVAKSPAAGLSPGRLGELVGRQLVRAVPKDHHIELADLSE